MPRRWFIGVLSIFIVVESTSGGCAGHSEASAIVDYSEGVFVGAVVDQETALEPDGRVWTHTVVRVDEAGKGEFPPYVRISTLGGLFEEWGDYDSRHQRIGNWPRALFIVKRSDGWLSLTEGLGAIVLENSLSDSALALEIWEHAGDQVGEDFETFRVDAISQRVVTSTGYLGDTNPSRLLWSDRGQRVPVLLDMDALPSGMTGVEARTAVDNALAAWSEVSSLSFYIEGTVSFGEAADDLDIGDERLRLQLHDLYGAISNGSTTLGVGGRSNTVDLGAGGTVKGQAFNPTRRAYVVMDHDKSTLEDPVAFEEVLTHEIGHALGLAHSSETASESDASLREAIMFFRVKNDGRGASLGPYDIEKIQGIHPLDNTPPFGIDHAFTMVTSFSTLPDYINSVELPIGDLQGDSTTIEIIETSEGAASFSLNGNTLTVIPNGVFGDGDTGGFFARAELRASDGTNLSPVFTVEIDAIRFEDGSDGLPDTWAQDEFGTTNPSGNRGPLDDFDNDGWTNFQEFRWGLDPEEIDVILSIDDFDGIAFDLSGERSVPFALYHSVDLKAWSVMNLFDLESSSGNSIAVSSDPSSANYYQFVPID